MSEFEIAKIAKIPVTTYVDCIQLSLTKKQVNILQHIFSGIGGSPNGPRGEIDRISEALDRLIGPIDSKSKIFATRGTVYIEDLEPKK